MCIAIIKPQCVEFPTEKQFRNCFETNPHGAGFMYSNGENLIIKKGFMTFEDFYSAFQKENISKDKLVFFHFRIATHGLIDGGNTHPFPLSMNVSNLRSTELKFKGYGLIHNGVFRYNIADFIKYDKSGVISDTMLFAMKIREALNETPNLGYDIESAIAYDLMCDDKVTKELIDDSIGYNKVAIMNEKEEYVKYGVWIEDNGVFYSNDDYTFDRQNYYQNYLFDIDLCVMCGNPLEKNKWKETNIGDCCDACLKEFPFKKCRNCEMYIYDDNSHDDNLCDECRYIHEYYDKHPEDFYNLKLLNEPC